MRSLKYQITVVICLAPRQIDRGDVGWPYTRRQKQGSTEAGPVGRKRHVVALFLNSIIKLLCNICQIYKNIIFNIKWKNKLYSPPEKGCKLSSSNFFISQTRKAKMLMCDRLLQSKQAYGVVQEPIAVSKNELNHVKPHLHGIVAHGREKDMQQKRYFLTLNKQKFGRMASF